MSPKRDEMMKRQQVLADFGELAIRSNDLDEILTEACRLVGGALGSGRAKILEIQKGRQELLVRAGVGWQPGIVGHERLSMDEASSEAYSIRVAEPVITQDVAEETRFHVPAFMREAGVMSLVNVPIFVPGQRPYGVLQVDDTKPRAFGNDEIQFLRTYATILGPVIDRLHLVEERRAEREQMFLSLSQAEGGLSAPSGDLRRHRDVEMELLKIISLLRTTFDNSVQVIQRFKAVRNEADEVVDFEWVLTNKRWNERWGTMTGKRLLTENPGVVSTGIWDKFLQVIATGEPVLHEQFYAHEQFDGWFLQGIAKADDGILLSTLEITEHKRIQEALRESEAHYEMLFNSIDQGFCVIEMIFDERGKPFDYRFLEANASFERQTGLKDVIGKRVSELQPDLEQHWFDIYGQIALSGEPQRFEERADTMGHWYSVYAFRVGEPHKRRVAVLFDDIRERKQAEDALRESEERLRSAVAVGRLGLWDWEIPTGKVHWSDEHFRMQGYTVGEVTPSYEAWIVRVHPDDRERVEASLRNAMETKEEYVDEFRSLHPDGSVRWLNGRGRFFYDAKGRPRRMIGAMIDTTDRRMWEDRQEVLVKELQHRTRNLMGVVRSIADMTAYKSQDLSDFSTRFRDRLNALARVQGLLSRLGAFDRVTFNELISTEINAMDGGSGRVSLKGPSNVRLRSSMVQTLSLALHELAINAVKYGALSQETGRLTVSWSLEHPAGDDRPWLVIDWRESGVILPEGAYHHGEGQGRDLIENALPYQLQARTSYVFLPDGVHCRISLPISKAKRDGGPA
ncbi:PAS domain-containing protein [Oryzifoliimicrobium ureilyticus]|uniref:PAS domain-containing protein n=1 Tax=Oryzifoliimicrobium ureilyticus TaxID=3113724 RepID=UPI003076081C